MELDATSWAVAGCSRLISLQYCMQKTSMKVVKWLLKLIILLDPFSRDRRRTSTTSHSSNSLITWRRRMRPLVPLPSRSRWRSSASISQSMQLASSSSPWSETTASWSSWERRGLEKPLSWHRYCICHNFHVQIFSTRCGNSRGLNSAIYLIFHYCK